MDLLVFVLLVLLDHNVVGLSMSAKPILVGVMLTPVCLAAMAVIYVDVIMGILGPTVAYLTCVIPILVTMVVPVI